MEFSQLEYYIALCKYGSYTKASEELNVSQPAISAAIKKLADECNDILVSKKKGEFSITPKGEVLLDGAIKIHNDMEKLKQELDALTLRQREIIRLALPFPLCPELLEEIVPRFGSVHTDVAIHLLQEGHRRIATGIKSRTIDLGVVCKDVIDDDLNSRFYKNLEYCPCFSANHRYAEEKTITPEMLKDETLIIPRIANTISNSIIEYLSAYDFEPHIKYVDVFPADVWKLAESGEGVAFMPVHSCGSNSARLDPPLYSELYVVWNRNQMQTSNKQSLIDYICSYNVEQEN